VHVADVDVGRALRHAWAPCAAAEPFTRRIFS
jgi:hypothetical protein